VAAVQPAASDRVQYAALWRRLWGAPVPNGVKVFAYRIAHAGLPCAAMRAVTHGLGVARAYCPHCQAPAVGAVRTRPLETYTHLFLGCPVYRPALEWLCDLWHAVSGNRPPLDAAALIADDQRGWPEAPTGARAALWSALRMVTLYHIWVAKVSGDARQQSAAAVVRAAIATLRTEMRVRFQRSGLAASHATDLPRTLCRSPLPPDPQPASFADIWACPGLCRVAASSSTGGSDVLVLLLSDLVPVPAP
jgi:hypothetical protein